MDYRECPELTGMVRLWLSAFYGDGETYQAVYEHLHGCERCVKNGEIIREYRATHPLSRRGGEADALPGTVAAVRGVGERVGMAA